MNRFVNKNFLFHKISLFNTLNRKLCNKSLCNKSEKNTVLQVKKFNTEKFFKNMDIWVKNQKTLNKLRWDLKNLE
jgi:hypothetical protein